MLICLFFLVRVLMMIVAGFFTSWFRGLLLSGILRYALGYFNIG
ncbi:MAG: hypothetical protein ACMUEM_03015 [Flavobacteriales bacterium AspAUS03]